MKVFVHLAQFGTLKLFCYIVQCHIQDFVSDLISSWASVDITRCQKMVRSIQTQTQTQTHSDVFRIFLCLTFLEPLVWLSDMFLFLHVDCCDHWPTGFVVSPWQVVEFFRYGRVPSSSWRQSASKNAMASNVTCYNLQYMTLQHNVTRFLPRLH